MKRGEFNNIDELIGELNLIPGTILSIGGDSDFFDCCHIDINPNEINVKEGWINSIHIFIDENGKIDMNFSIELKFDTGFSERPTVTVKKSWIDKNVSKIRIWSYK